MPATALEIWDSIIKVGFGAGITAVVALLVQRRNQVHDFKKDRYQRRQTTIEKISEDIEYVAQFARSFNSTITVLCFICKDARSLDDLNEYSKALEQVKDLDLKLASAVGRLELLGLDDTAARCVSFKGFLRGFVYAATLDDEDAFKRHQNAYENFEREKKALVKSLRKDYSSAL